MNITEWGAKAFDNVIITVLAFGICLFGLLCLLTAVGFIYALAVIAQIIFG